MSTARLTTDHKTIENWVKARDGKPAEVDGSGKGGAGLLRIEFSPMGDDGDTDGLKRLSWPSFWKRFDEQELAFLYQDETGRGETSRFCKLVYAPQGLLRTLHDEHEQIRSLLAKMQESTSQAVKTRPQFLEQLRELLIPHMAGEKKAFYKKLKKSVDQDRIKTVLEGCEEHRHVKNAFARIEKADVQEPDWSARLSVLKELVEHHIQAEEEEIFDLARNALGQQGLEDVQAQYMKQEKKAKNKM